MQFIQTVNTQNYIVIVAFVGLIVVSVNTPIMTKEVNPTMNNAWIWLDQQTSVDNYPKITNFKGTQISIAPRRYIVQLETRLSAEELENKLDEITRESSFRKSVSSIHNYSAAREPLHTCTSHFQILQVETSIYLMLNNISSQSIRSTLIEQTLEHLWTSKIHYSIGLIWIQTGHENATPRCYKVQMKWEVIEVITKAINHTHEYIVDETKYVKPWTLRAWIAMNHVCEALENEPEVNPNLLQVNQAQKRKGQENPQAQVPAKKKTTAVDAKKYWTFILHKQYQSPNWKSERAKGQQPNFISIDHGDHYHIIFECANDGNVQRSRKRIAEFLGSNIKGIAEATFTCTKIKLLVNFVLYCLRYGIRSLNKYGTKIMPLVKTIEDLFETNEDEVDSIDLDAICKPYVEENKEMRKKKNGEK